MDRPGDPLLDIFASAHRPSPGPNPDGDLGRAPSIYLWGTSRPVVNLVLYGLARRTDPDFAWVEIRDRGSLPASGRLGEDGSSEPWGQSIHVRAEELLPRSPVAPPSVSQLVRLDDDPGELDRLQQFVVLPAPVQAFAARSMPNGGPRVLAIPNADRVADLYAGRALTLRRLIQTMQEVSISLMTGRADGPGPLRNVFDYVFEVRSTDLRTWEDGQLLCERTANPKALPVGRAFPLVELAWATDVLSAATRPESRSEPPVPHRG